MKEKELRAKNKELRPVCVLLSWLCVLLSNLSTSPQFLLYCPFIFLNRLVPYYPGIIYKYSRGSININGFTIAFILTYLISHLLRIQASAELLLIQA